MFAVDDLEAALATLGEVLADREVSFDLALIGGGALLLLGAIERPTKDLDIVARVEAGDLVQATPLPPILMEAVSDVAGALGLPHSSAAADV